MRDGINEIDDVGDVPHAPTTQTTPTQPPVPPATNRTSHRRVRREGTLDYLSESMRKLARMVAASMLFLTVYDNINMMWKVAEQIVGRTGKLCLHGLFYSCKGS